MQKKTPSSWQRRIVLPVLLQGRRLLRYLQSMQTMFVIWLGTIAVALMAVLLAELTERGFAGFMWLTQRYWWVALILTPLSSVMVYAVLARWVPGALGGGIPQTKAAIRQVTNTSLLQNVLSIPVLLAKGLAVTIVLSMGMVLGRQGPTVQMGAALMYGLRRFLKKPSPHLHRQLILAGAAAGIAAAFNTPLAGIVFALEELSSTIEEKSSGVVISAVIFAGLVAQYFLGNFFFFGRIYIPVWSFSDGLWMVLLLAALCGLVGGGFSWMVAYPERWIPRKLFVLRVRFPLGFVAVCGLIVAVLGIWWPIYGSGTLEVAQALDAGQPLPQGYALTKTTGMLASIMSGLSGGVFAPSLAVGAGLGSLLASWEPQVPLAAMMSLGMVAVLAAITRAPLTSAVIVMEMVDAHHMLMMILLASFIGGTVARVFRCNLYEVLAQRILQNARDS